MIKMIFLVNRKPGMAVDEFRRYWTETHGPIAARMQGVRKYVQHHAVPGPDGSEPAFDGFAEIWWDDAETMAASLASPEGRAAEADAAGLFDIERIQVFAVEQATIV